VYAFLAGGGAAEARRRRLFLMPTVAPAGVGADKGDFGSGFGSAQECAGQDLSASCRSAIDGSVGSSFGSAQKCAGPDLSTSCCSAIDGSVALLDGGPGGSEPAGTLVEGMGSEDSESGVDESVTRVCLCTLIWTCCW